MDLEEITKEELKKEPQKGINVLLQTYNKGLGEIPWEFFNSASFALINSKRFVSLPKYRLEVAKNYIRKRIDNSEEKNRISKEEADYLRSHIKDNASEYVIDLFVQSIGFNLAGQIPALFENYIPLFSGELSFRDFLIRSALIGMALRKSWTIGRIIYYKKEGGLKSSIKKRSTALYWETVPFAGSFMGYLSKMIYSEYEAENRLGRFLLDDHLYGIEKILPPVKKLKRFIFKKIYKD